MILDKFKLDGKTALVTGGNKGIGKGYATALAEAGADIISVSYENDFSEIEQIVKSKKLFPVKLTQKDKELKEVKRQLKEATNSIAELNKQVKNLLSLGCKEFIQKPFTVHELSQKVDAVLA